MNNTKGLNNHDIAFQLDKITAINCSHLDLLLKVFVCARWTPGTSKEI